MNPSRREFCEKRTGKLRTAEVEHAKTIRQRLSIRHWFAHPVRPTNHEWYVTLAMNRGVARWSGLSDLEMRKDSFQFDATGEDAKPEASG